MSVLSEKNNGVYDVVQGSSIRVAIEDAIVLARDSDAKITFRFQGTLVRVRSDSDPDYTYAIWREGQEGGI